jgi:predicted metal-dependent phosphoesterase TrpH
MKTELHLHTNAYSECATLTPEEMMAAALAAGYEAVCITEHNAVWPAERLAALQAMFPAVRIIPGVELTVVDFTLHLVVLGTNDPEYLPLRRDPRAVIERARAHGHLTVLAHPFRWGGAEDLLQSGSVPDAIEHRTANHPAPLAQVSRQWADALGLALVNAGDTHSLAMLDRFWIETTRPIERAEDIREIVVAGQYENCMHRGEDKDTNDTKGDE